MSETDIELLSQYLDGELGAPQVQALEKRLAAEPSLQAELDRLREVNDALRNAFDFPGADEVPSSVSAMLGKPASERADNVVAFPQKRRTGLGFAVAASLLAATGLLFFEQGQQGLEEGGYADPVLAEVLEQSPSRSEGWESLADNRQVRPVLSFRSKSANWCREYLLDEGGVHWRGIACREGTHWIHEAIVQVEPTHADAASEYRPAGAGDADQINQYIDRNADGIALGARAEAELIDSGWK